MKTRREIIKMAGAAGVFSFFDRHLIHLLLNDKKINKTMSNSSTMKTIGILGGIGPQATMNFEAEVHIAAQRIIPPLYNSGYPPMVVYYHRYAPVLINKDLTPVLPVQPDPGLLTAAKRLGSMSDFLVITSNGVHMMQNEIEKAAGCKVLSMIDVTLDEVQKRKWRRIGVIGYRNAMIYTNRLKEMNVEFETVNNDDQVKLDESIMRVMEGRERDSDRQLIQKMVADLRERKVDGIILGCTELPILLKGNLNDGDMVNPGRLLAEAAVKYSLF